MFLRLVFSRIKILLRTKSEICWTLLFPIILGTFFYIAFGGVSERTEKFEVVPVAVVEINKEQEFDTLLTELSKEGEDQLLSVTKVNADKANELLNDNEVKAIITVSDSIQMKVNDKGISQTIVKAVIDQYLQSKAIIQDVVKNHPEKMEATIKSISSEITFTKEISLSGSGVKDPMIQYFYALIAMGCLYGCFLGLKSATSIQANLSALAARRTVTPTHRLKLIFADFVGTVIVQFFCVLALICYLLFVLKVDMNNNLGYIILTAFFGSVIGVANGIFVGSISHKREEVKMGVLSSVTMLLCFLSGLMMGTMKYIIEQNIPFLNRINPAALISDALYSLNIYDTYDRFYRNIITLGVMAIVLCVASFLVVRREKYASL